MCGPETTAPLTPKLCGSPWTHGKHVGVEPLLLSSWVGFWTHLEIREVLCHEIVDFADGKASGLAVL